MEYWKLFMDAKNKVYLPAVRPFFSEIDTGHKDFVRSFVHLAQSGPLNTITTVENSINAEFLNNYK